MSVVAIARPRALTPALQAVLAAAVLASPWFGWPHLDSRLLTTALLYGIAASGLNLMFGYAGMLSLGSAMFIGTGAYTVTIGVQHGHWPVLVAVGAGLAISAIAAFLLALILVRLSGHYFGVATLGLAMAFSGLMIALPNLTGGGSGMTISRRLNLGFVTVASDLQWYALAVATTACMLLVLRWIVAGKRGRILRLIRQDELSASVLGVPVYWAKVAVFVAGSLFVAIGGSLLVLWQGVVVPETVGVIPSVQFIALVVIGGAGYRLGGFIGALLILWLQAVLS
ncbi:MAG: branched-chain amino acid ABC transporter permease, partial [Chloroflexota bacterium]|nr:branched-chain amino acid ABC transporter permease [Chloroflexota bacterium]